MLKINKDIEIEDSNIKLESLVPVTLYSNNTGGTAGVVTLNDSIMNYKMIKVYAFMVGVPVYCKEIIDFQIGTQFRLNCQDLDGTTTRLFQTVYQFSNNTTITPITTTYTYILQGNHTIGHQTDVNYAKIFKVIGYK